MYKKCYNNHIIQRKIRATVLLHHQRTEWKQTQNNDYSFFECQTAGTALSRLLRLNWTLSRQLRRLFDILCHDK